MTSIKAKLRPSSVSGKKGRIVYYVNKNGVSRQIKTDYRLYPYEWNAEYSKVIESDDIGLKLISNHIAHDMERLQTIVEKFAVRGIGFSSEMVVNEYARLRNDNSLFCFMENSIERFKQMARFGTAKNYRSTLSSIVRFREGKDILLDEIDSLFVEDYEAYLQSRDLSPNTTSFYMRILRAAYNRAVEQKVTTDRRPFRSVFTGMEKTRKRAISLSEMKQIRDLELIDRPYLEFARDIFLFLFYCRGMSFIDAAFLKKTDIRNGILCYRRHKTNQPLNIRVVSEMTEIIDRYGSKSTPYLLPIICMESRDGRKQYQAAIHRVNKALKKIGIMAGLHIPLTTYVSRHAWATIAKRKNIPLPVISEALGHDSELTTRIYLASMDSSVIDQANSLIISEL